MPKIMPIQNKQANAFKHVPLHPKATRSTRVYQQADYQHHLHRNPRNQILARPLAAKLLVMVCAKSPSTPTVKPMRLLW